jgi:HlyD family secretion protein
MTWFKRIVAALFLLAVAGIVALSLKPKKEKPLEVQLAKVQRAAITRTVSGAGKLDPATQVKVSSNLSGDLLELTVKEGDTVKKGQLLARIDSRRYAAQVQQAQAAVASLKAELVLAEVEAGRLGQERERVKRLVATSSASQAELDRANSEVAAQEARVQSVKERIAQSSAALAEAAHFLSMTTLYAPLDGVVTSAPKKVGERVRGSDFTEDVILVISTLNAMEVKVEVGEHEVVYIKEGNQAEVEVDAFPDKKWPATVVEIAKNANIKNQGTEAEVTTFFVRLALTAPLPGGLPGMSAEVGIATETHEDALVVPIQAVAARTEKELKGEQAGGAGAVVENQAPVIAGRKRRARDPLQKVVFVVEEGLAKARRVETGLASETDIEIPLLAQDGRPSSSGPKGGLHELQDGKPGEPRRTSRAEGSNLTGSPALLPGPRGAPGRQGAWSGPGARGPGPGEAAPPLSRSPTCARYTGWARRFHALAASPSRWPGSGWASSAVRVGQVHLMNSLGCLTRPLRLYRSRHRRARAVRRRAGRPPKGDRFVFRPTAAARSTALANVELPAHLPGRLAQRARRRAQEALAKVCLSQRMGQHQRALRRPAPARGGGAALGGDPRCCSRRPTQPGHGTGEDIVGSRELHRAGTPSCCHARAAAGGACPRAVRLSDGKVSPTPGPRGGRRCRCRGRWAHIRGARPLLGELREGTGIAFFALAPNRCTL